MSKAIFNIVRSQEPALFAGPPNGQFKSFLIALVGILSITVFIVTVKF
jgi:hypothetical protein